MKKIISLLLALMLVVSMIPMAVCAAGLKLTDYKEFGKSKDGGYYAIKHGSDTKIPITAEQYKQLLKDAEKFNQSEKTHEPNKHTYSVKYNNKYHWLACPCGCTISMERHVDPKEAKNDYCTCGFHFSSNADLVTLWVAGCPEIKNFDKNKTEYTLNAYTYKDVKEVKISTRTGNSQATVELPEDLTLKEGENIIPVKVIAGNQRDTKTYTLTIIKESN